MPSESPRNSATSKLSGELWFSVKNLVGSPSGPTTTPKSCRFEGGRVLCVVDTSLVPSAWNQCPSPVVSPFDGLYTSLVSQKPKARAAVSALASNASKRGAMRRKRTTHYGWMRCRSADRQRAHHWPQSEDRVSESSRSAEMRSAGVASRGNGETDMYDFPILRAWGFLAPKGSGSFRMHRCPVPSRQALELDFPQYHADIRDPVLRQQRGSLR